MTKRQIDKYFSANHSTIVDYIKNSFFKTNIFDEEPDFFLTECYLYVLERKDDIEDTEMLQKYISTFIYNHTRWTGSNVREMGTAKKQALLTEFNPEIMDTPDTVEPYDEQEEIDYEALNEIYYQSLTTIEEIAVWEIYFLQGMTSHRKFGEHIGRSKSVGDKYINWLRADIKRFYSEYQAKNG